MSGSCVKLRHDRFHPRDLEFSIHQYSYRSTVLLRASLGICCLALGVVYTESLISNGSSCYNIFENMWFLAEEKRRVFNELSLTMTSVSIARRKLKLVRFKQWDYDLCHYLMMTHPHICFRHKIAHLIHVQQIPGSNLGQRSDCLVRFLFFSTVSPGKWQCRKVKKCKFN
jgi:hypothetical protein